MALEILHGPLVLLRGGAARKGAEIAPPAGLRILFARIEPILAGRELTNHGVLPKMRRIDEAKMQQAFPSAASYSAAWTVLVSSATSATK